MKRTSVLIIAFLFWALSGAQAQFLPIDQSNNENPTRSPKDKVELRFARLPFSVGAGGRSRAPGFSLMPAGSGSASMTVSPLAFAPNLPVLGGGTVGRLAKWTGINSSNSFIGDSTIFESKLGLVGIGTDTPTSKLTVAGTIQSLTGGFQFPDGTVQTTSASGLLSGVSHDATLTGDGTSGSPLGVAVPLTLTNSTGSGGPVLRLDNPSGGGLSVIGGNGGTAVSANGGDNNSVAGNGMQSRGGSGVAGGAGLFSFGGDGTGGGGNGISTIGGFSASGTGGNGITASPGSGGAGDGLAGRFNGDVEVTGNLSKGGGSFKIDHPLDPETKYLYHSFVESPDMKNIYDGNVTTDENGQATITLPDYFEALNRDFRYQLTVVGTFAQAIVAEKIKGNRFVIRTNSPNVEVSWQVTGIRQDPWARKNRIQVEVEKTNRERGFYLHPEAFDQPDERGIEWAQNPALMQQRRQQRIDSKQKPKDK